MAESKRRSDVKKFVHNTSYPRISWPLQPSLFDNVLQSIKQEWSCTRNSDIIPDTGSIVFVRAFSDQKPNVLWGNQIIAEVTDISVADLTAALCCPEKIGGVVATIISNGDSDSQFAIRLTDNGS